MRGGAARAIDARARRTCSARRRRRRRPRAARASTPGALVGGGVRGEALARARAPASANLERGATASTSFHSTARLPLMPSASVAKTSAQIAAHAALVDDAREAAGARQHAEQRHLGQATPSTSRRRAARSRRRRAPARSRRRRSARCTRRASLQARVGGWRPRAQRRVSLVNLQKLTLNGCVELTRACGCWRRRRRCDPCRW